MAQMYDPDPDGEWAAPSRPVDLTREKSLHMRLADQVDQSGGSPFPRVLRRPVSAALVFLLLLTLTALLLWLGGAF